MSKIGSFVLKMYEHGQNAVNQLADAVETHQERHVQAFLDDEGVYPISEEISRPMALEEVSEERSALELAYEEYITH